MPTARHNISLRVNETIIDRWQRYSITSDMLTPADGFELALSPGVKAAYDLVPPDSLVEIRIDDTPVLTGFIDDRNLVISKQGSTLDVSGRDKGGRLVDESSRLFKFGRLDLKKLAKLIAEDTYDQVLLDNRLNRDLIRGRRSGKAPANSEPLFTKRSESPKKVEIGDTRWAVLQHFLKPARLLAWSSADGKSLILGKPNYAQLPQFRFFVPKSGSSRITLGNVKSASLVTSVANRFSLITVFGASKGDSTNYGKRVTAYQATVTDGNDVGGTGKDFKERKRLFLSDPDVANARDSLERAKRELAFRNAEACVLELVVEGHSQARNPGEVPAVFAYDTMAEVEIEEIEFKGQFLLTSCVYGVDRDGGEVTTIKLVPKNTELVS